MLFAIILKCFHFTSGMDTVYGIVIVGSLEFVYFYFLVGIIFRKKLQASLETNTWGLIYSFTLCVIEFLLGQIFYLVYSYMRKRKRERVDGLQVAG